jgi:hypothetical protein
LLYHIQHKNQAKNREHNIFKHDDDESIKTNYLM